MYSELQKNWNNKLLWMLLIAALWFSGNVKAEDCEQDRHGTYLQIGAYIHFSDREDHAGPPVLLIVGRLRPRGYYYGLALFNNSFNQFSQFLHVGREFPWQWLHEDIHFKLSLGLIHGYRDEFEDELPLTYKGFSPGLVPSIGFRRNRVGFDLTLLSNAGLALSVGYQF